MKTLQFISTIVLFSSGLAFGQSGIPNPPEMSHVKKVGRVLAFPTFKENIWFSPTAFSADFECSSTATSLCTLRVFNKLSDAEADELQALPQAGQQLLFFNDVDTRIVSGVKDEFSFIPSFNGMGQSMMMNTLAMSERFPYSQYQARVSSGLATELKNSFQENGIGLFISRFHLNGEWTEDYLSIEDTTPVLKVLKELVVEAQNLPVIRTELMRAFDASSLAANRFNHEEASILAYRFFVMNYLMKTDAGKYTVSPESLASMKSRLVIVNESHPVGMNCTASLVLKKGAIASTNCYQE